MTTDAEWAKLPEAWRGRLVWAKLFQNKPMPIAPSELASTWPGFGLVVAEMKKKDWHLNLKTDGKRAWAEWTDRTCYHHIQSGWIVGHPASAAAFAAVRALEEGK